MRNYPFRKFIYGTLNKPPIQTIPDGVASASLNWITTRGIDGGGMIELCRGYTILGTEQSGVGRITGLKVGKNFAGTEIPFATYARKIRYYDPTLSDWTEIGTDTLPLAASGEDITFAFFEPRAGKQMWFNSPNAGPYKIGMENLNDITAMYDSSKNYKAWMSIFDNQAYIWNIDNSDKTAVRLSYIETRGLADYTQTSAETCASGDAVTKTFSGTLAFKAAGPKRSCLDVSFTDSNETFTDNLNGTLTGSLGGSGTINYTTGAYSIIFNSAPAASSNNITATYRYVDESAAGGIADFLVPGSRVSGNPNVFRQDHGDNIQSIVSLKDHKFCGHKKSIYDLLPNLDDTKTTNTLFRDNVGIPYLRSLFTTPEGIYAIDLYDPSQPKFVLISYSSRTTDIKPTVISKDLDLTTFTFDKAFIGSFNDYILFSCATKDSTFNNRTWLYHRIYHTFDLLDYYISTAEVYNGALIAGDSVTNNVQQLFSGLDANGDVITNYWKSGITKLGFINPRGKIYAIRSLKKVKKMLLEGNVGPTQKIHVYLSFDRGPFVEVLDEDGGCFIDGQASYIDHTQRVTIGSPVLGTTEIGGGSDGIEAYHYERLLHLKFDKFFECQIMFATSDIGYASVLNCEFRDIRILQDKPPRKYRVV